MQKPHSLHALPLHALGEQHLPSEMHNLATQARPALSFRKFEASCPIQELKFAHCRPPGPAADQQRAGNRGVPERARRSRGGNAAAGARLWRRPRSPGKDHLLLCSVRSHNARLWLPAVPHAEVTAAQLLQNYDYPGPVGAAFQLLCSCMRRASLKQSTAGRMLPR
jgi:hypothetical protein